MAVKMEVSTDVQKSIENLNRLCGSLEKTAESLDKAAKGFDGIKKAMENNNIAIGNMAKAMQSVSMGLSTAGEQMENVSSKTKDATKNQQELGKESNNTAKGMELSFSKVATVITMVLGTIKKVISAIKNLANKMQEMVKPQAQYIENLNFLEQAYKSADSSGKQLLDTLEKTVGYDPANLVQTMATFRQLGNALDMDSKIADTLANNLVKLSVDVKSITGQELTKVASKFQSAMAGNIRAVRAYGVDVTQAALQQELLRMGIDRKVSSLNRAEKSILTYITMTRQLSTANGDLSRTVNSVGNQWEIFQNQLAELGRLIGGFFIPVLKAILPILNGIIMALNTIISMVMSFFGIDAEGFAKEFGATATSIDDTSDAFDDMASSAGKAGKAAKEAQKSLRGFDKLNNITTPTKSGSGSGSSSAVGGSIDPNLLKGLKEYDLHLESMANWATKIRDKIMEWLGFTKLEDIATGKVSYQFGGMHKIIKRIYQLFEDNPLGKLKRNWLALADPVQFFNAEMKRTLILNDDVWKSFNKLIGQLVDKVAPIITTVVNDIGVAIDWFKKNILEPVQNFIDERFTAVWQDILLPLFEKFNKELLPDLTKAFTDLWENAIKPVADIVGGALSTALNHLINILNPLWKNIINPLINFIIGIGFNGIKLIVTYISQFVIPIITSIIGILSTVWHKYLEPIATFISDIIVAAVEGASKNIGSAIDAIKGVFEGLFNFVDKVFKGDWEGAIGEIGGIFDKVFKPFTTVLDNIKKGFDKVVGAVGKLADKVDVVKKGIGKIGSGAVSFVSSWLGLKASGGIWNNGIWSPVKAYAAGGFPSRGEIFMARETKGPELVGRIGSSTAVLNNDQILEQMTIAVARGIAASGSKGTNVNIVAEADTEGLLNFINFKNASKNRQYGL